MLDSLSTSKSELISSSVVFVATIFLILLTGWIFNWAGRKLREAGYSSNRKSLRTIKRILNLLWFLLGISALAFLFLGDSGTEFIRRNVKISVYIAGVLVTTIILINVSNYWFREKTEKRDARNEDTTNLKFLRYISLISIYFAGILFVLLAFPALKGVAQTALGGAGIIALVAGIASQEALANIIGGFFIIWFKPFKIGDTVRVDTMQGVVTDITLRHTVIKDYDNNRIVIPNSIINKARLINFDLQEQRVCERIEIGVSYRSDLNLAQNIMREICEVHPNTIDVRTSQDKKKGVPLVKTAITRIEESAIIVRAWVWASNVDNGFGLRFSVLEQAKERFDREGIEIPHPYRSLVLQQDNRAVAEPLS